MGANERLLVSFSHCSSPLFKLLPPPLPYLSDFNFNVCTKQAFFSDRSLRHWYDARLSRDQASLPLTSPSQSFTPIAIFGWHIHAQRHRYAAAFISSKLNICLKFFSPCALLGVPLKCENYTRATTFSLRRTYCTVRVRPDKVTPRLPPPVHAQRILESIQAPLAVKQLDDWYSITSSRISAQSTTRSPALYVQKSNQILITTGKEAKALVKKFNYSTSKLLEYSFPNHEWLPWKFTNVPKSFFKQRANRRKYFDWLGANVYNIKQLSDWYNAKIKISTQ